MPHQRREVRDRRTPRDPSGDVWNAEVVPLIELLQARHLGQFTDGQARTRRLRDWRAAPRSRKCIPDTLTGADALLTLRRCVPLTSAGPLSSLAGP